MKKFLFLIIVLFTIVSCREYSNVTNDGTGVRIIDIKHNGHEYIYFEDYYGVSNHVLHSPSCPCQIENRY